MTAEIAKSRDFRSATRTAKTFFEKSKSVEIEANYANEFFADQRNAIYPIYLRLLYSFTSQIDQTITNSFNGFNNFIGKKIGENSDRYLSFDAISFINYPRIYPIRHAFQFTLQTLLIETVSLPNAHSTLLSFNFSSNANANFYSIQPLNNQGIKKCQKIQNVLQWIVWVMQHTSCYIHCVFMKAFIANAVLPPKSWWKSTSQI